MSPRLPNCCMRGNAVYADAGYTGVEKREERENREVVWQIAARRSTYSSLSQGRTCTLPVGETGEVKRKGSMKGGGSPGLHKPMLLWVRKAGDTLHRGEASPLRCARGSAP